jgi:hypothetical protein
VNGKEPLRHGLPCWGGKTGSNEGNRKFAYLGNHSSRRCLQLYRVVSQILECLGLSLAEPGEPLCKCDVKASMADDRHVATAQVTDRSS